MAWHIHFIEAEEIDQINIRQAVLKGMRECIHQNLMKIGIDNKKTDDVLLLIDGNDFPPYIMFDENTDTIQTIAHETIPGGDNLYAPIACASILAKTARDEYILDLCGQFPELSTKYKIDKNMGYGTKHHLDGILEHGITQWHRKTYGRCKEWTV
jgi:ribonuclease HII